jgi:hypothetical protein
VIPSIDDRYATLPASLPRLIHERQIADCMLNPLRSEDEAFRFLVRAIAVFAVIIMLIVIVRAVA